jgi:hypothetical protein
MDGYPSSVMEILQDFQVMISSPGETSIGTGSGPTNKGNKSSSTKDGRGWNLVPLSKKDEEQQAEKGFLVALLSLAVVICNRMVDAHDFACAAPEDMASLVKKLKDIIQTNNTTTVECLQTVKLSCQLVVSMVQLKPICIKDFIEDNFMEVLSESSKILSDLDNCLMLFDVNYLQVTKTDKPLVSLVKQAQKLLPTKHKKQGDCWNLVSII